jgi:hypothetical protein
MNESPVFLLRKNGLSCVDGSSAKMNAAFHDSPGRARFAHAPDSAPGRQAR